MSEEFGSRLSRWSRRKAAARRGGALPEDPPAAPAETPAAPLPAPGPVPEAEAVPAEPLGLDACAEAEPVLQLPSIESLTAESDYTAFLAKNVPETLRRAALRKLWTSDPMLACLDGLNDYDEDFNAVETLVDMAQTSYRVGRGYVDEIEEKLAALAPGESPAAQESPDSAAASEETMGESDAPVPPLSAAPQYNTAAPADDVAPSEIDNAEK